MRFFFFLICLMQVLFACKRDSDLQVYQGLEGKWKYDSTGNSWGWKSAYVYWQISGLEVQQFQGVFPVEWNGGMELEHVQTGKIRFKSDTSFINPITKEVYTGKGIHIDFFVDDSIYAGYKKGIYEVSKDSLVIHTSCCYRTFRYARVNKFE